MQQEVVHEREKRLLVEDALKQAQHLDEGVLKEQKGKIEELTAKLADVTRNREQESKLRDLRSRELLVSRKRVEGLEKALDIVRQQNQDIQDGLLAEKVIRALNTQTIPDYA